MNFLKIIKGTNKELGGTMRLGLYKAKLRHNSLVKKIYKSKSVFERHRHRYEVNNRLKDKFEKKGLIFSGMSPDNLLPEIIELTTTHGLLVFNFIQNLNLDLCHLILYSHHLSKQQKIINEQH